MVRVLPMLALLMASCGKAEPDVAREVQPYYYWAVDECHLSVDKLVSVTMRQLPYGIGGQATTTNVGVAETCAIDLDWDNWQELTDRERSALLAHEMMHCQGAIDLYEDASIFDWMHWQAIGPEWTDFVWDINVNKYCK